MTEPFTKDTGKPATITRITAPRHKWRYDGAKLRDTTPSGCDETERSCELCGLVKITVHAPFGFPYRAWRSKGGVRFPDGGLTPPCDGGADMSTFSSAPTLARPHPADDSINARQRESSPLSRVSTGTSL